MSWAKKVDANQKEIVRCFRDLGAKVFPTHGVGSGFPDLVVQYAYPARRFKMETMLVEIKDGSLSKSRRRLTDDQAEFHANFLCHIVESEKDVHELLEYVYQD